MVATELGDLRRFEHSRQLMASGGLIPGEHSSGDRRRLGAIMNAGTARERHMLGLSVKFGLWRFSMRKCNTELVVRLNVGEDVGLLEEKRGDKRETFHYCARCRRDLQELSRRVFHS